MLKTLRRAMKIGSLLGLAVLPLESSLAAHGSYNPMMPRQLSEQSANADYTYGYSLLSGHALDSMEELNRYMWFVNYEIFDKYILRPVAHGYAALPRGLQDSIGHFFDNLDEVNNIPNNLLIGEFADSGTSAGRLVINSTIGLLGFFDVASSMGLAAKPMAMETVLGKAGMEQGHFLMVPMYGPTTNRDLQGSNLDGIVWYTASWPFTITKWVVGGIHKRAQLVDQESVIDNAIDPYIQTRDAYLMYDEKDVNPLTEGEVKVEEEFDDALLDEIDG